MNGALAAERDGLSDADAIRKSREAVAADRRNALETWYNTRPPKQDKPVIDATWEGIKDAYGSWEGFKNGLKHGWRSLFR